MEIRQGQIIALFAFDIGFEVSMDKLSGLLSSVPPHLQYSRPPRLVSLGNADDVEGSLAVYTPRFSTLEPPALLTDGDSWMARRERRSTTCQDSAMNGITPDGSPLVLRSVKTSEIYALEWVLP